MNILLTSAGRRGYLVNFFKEALEGKGEVHVMNSSDHSTAMRYGDKSILSPLIYSTDYIPFLVKYCVENKIDAIISLLDIDLPILSNQVKTFEQIGVKLLVSPKEVVSVCNDKWRTFNYLKENGFHTPKTFLSIGAVIMELENGDIDFPLMIKPRWGMGSIAIFEVNNMDELIVLYKKTKSMIERSDLSFESVIDGENNIIIQEKLIGQEYGLDIINDLEGNYKTTIPKMKLAMRSGETDIAEIIEDSKLETLGMGISQNLRHIGNLDVDVFIVEDIPFVLEMNARFGGGYPFSHLAGVDLPKAIIKWLDGKTVENSLLKAKIGVTGYKDIHMIGKEESKHSELEV